jgi:hypothetical protein
MSIRPYLPSAQFAFLVLSLFISVGLVYGAQMVTKPHNNTLTAATREDSMAAAVQNANWQASLNEIQAQSGAQLPEATDPQIVEAMRQAAKSNNLTDSVSKTLLVNLTNVKSQGLGDDIPTQNQLLAAAQQQLQGSRKITSYTTKDMVVVSDSIDAQKRYGNAVMQALSAHPLANIATTLQIIAQVIDTNDGETLKKLLPIAADYRALTDQLLKIPVPKTLSPFHLQLVNDYERITASYDDMQVVLTDPLRGLYGLQTYQSAASMSVKVFTNIAQAFNKNGILFSKDEPGAAWAALLSAH